MESFKILMWIAMTTLLLLQGCKLVASRPSGSAERTENYNVSKDYYALQNLLSKHLGGTSTEKSKVIDLLLQLLEEIDLPTLCEVIVNDTKANQKARLRVPIKYTKIDDDLLNSLDSQITLETENNDATSQTPSKMTIDADTTTYAESREQIIATSNDEEMGALIDGAEENNHTPATYNYHTNELNNGDRMSSQSSQSVRDGGLNNVNYPDTLSSSDLSFGKENPSNDLPGEDLLQAGQILYSSLLKDKIAPGNEDGKPVKSVRDLKQTYLRAQNMNIDEVNEMLHGYTDDINNKNIVVEQIDVDRPRAQLFSKSLVLGDWMNKNKFDRNFLTTYTDNEDEVKAIDMPSYENNVVSSDAWSDNVKYEFKARFSPIKQQKYARGNLDSQEIVGQMLIPESSTPFNTMFTYDPKDSLYSMTTVEDQRHVDYPEELGSKVIVQKPNRSISTVAKDTNPNPRDDMASMAMFTQRKSNPADMESENDVNDSDSNETSKRQQTKMSADYSTTQEFINNNEVNEINNNKIAQEIATWKDVSHFMAESRPIDKSDEFVYREQGVSVDINTQTPPYSYLTTSPILYMSVEQQVQPLLYERDNKTANTSATQRSQNLSEIATQATLVLSTTVDAEILTGNYEMTQRTESTAQEQTVTETAERSREIEVQQHTPASNLPQWAQRLNTDSSETARTQEDAAVVSGQPEPGKINEYVILNNEEVKGRNSTALFESQTAQSKITYPENDPINVSTTTIYPQMEANMKEVKPSAISSSFVDTINATEIRMAAGNNATQDWMANDSAVQTGVHQNEITQALVPNSDVTQAGVTNSDVTQAGVTNSDVTQAVVTNSDVTQAGVTNSDATQAGVTNSDATQAGVTNSDVTQAGITKSDATQAGITNSDVTQAGVTNSDVTQAGITNSDVTQAGITNSDVTQAGISNSDVTEAEVTNNDVTEAGITNSDVTQTGLRNNEVTQSGVRENDITQTVVNYDGTQTGVTTTDATQPGISNNDATQASITSSDFTQATYPNNHLTKEEVINSEVTPAVVTNSDITQASASINEATQAEVTNSDITQAEVTNSDSTQAEVTNSDITQAEVTNSDSTQAGVSNTDVIQARIIINNATQIEVNKNEITQAGVRNNEVTQAGVSNNEVTQAGVSNNEVTQAEVTNSDTTQAGVSNTDAMQARIKINNAIQIEANKNVLTQAGVSNNEVTQAGASNNEVTQAEVSNNEVTQAEVSNNEVTQAGESNNEVTQAGVSNNEVTQAGVSNNEFTQAEVSNNEVTQAEVSNNEVTQAGVSNNEVTQARVSNNEVTQAKVSNNEVTQARVSNNEVTQAEVSNNEVTLAGVSNTEVTQAGVSNNEVTQAEVSNNEVTQDEVSNNEVTQAGVSNNEVTQAEVSKKDDTQARTTHADITNIVTNNVTYAEVRQTHVPDDEVTNNQTTTTDIVTQQSSELGATTEKIQHTSEVPAPHADYLSSTQTNNSTVLFLVNTTSDARSHDVSAKDVSASTINNNLHITNTVAVIQEESALHEKEIRDKMLSVVDDEDIARNLSKDNKSDIGDMVLNTKNQTSVVLSTYRNVLGEQILSNNSYVSAETMESRIQGDVNNINTTADRDMNKHIALKQINENEFNTTSSTEYYTSTTPEVTSSYSNSQASVNSSSVSKIMQSELQSYRLLTEINASLSVNVSNDGISSQNVTPLSLENSALAQSLNESLDGANTTIEVENATATVASAAFNSEWSASMQTDSTRLASNTTAREATENITVDSTVDNFHVAPKYVLEKAANFDHFIQPAVIEYGSNKVDESTLDISIKQQSSESSVEPTLGMNPVTTQKATQVIGDNQTHHKDKGIYNLAHTQHNTTGSTSQAMISFLAADANGNETDNTSTDAIQSVTLAKPIHTGTLSQVLRTNNTIDNLKMISSKIAETKANLSRINMALLKPLRIRIPYEDSTEIPKNTETTGIREENNTSLFKSEVMEQQAAFTPESTSAVPEYIDNSTQLTYVETPTVSQVQFTTTEPTTSTLTASTSEMTSPDPKVSISSAELIASTITVPKSTIPESSRPSPTDSSYKTDISTDVTPNMLDGHSGIFKFSNVPNSDNLSNKDKTQISSTSLPKSGNEAQVYNFHFLPMNEKYQNKPRNLPYKSQFSERPDQAKLQTKPIIDSWKAYNIVVGKSKANANNQDIAKNSGAPEVHLYSNIKYTPAPADNLLRSYLWQARPWPKNAMYNSDQGDTPNRMMAAKPELYQNQNMDRSKSVNYQTKTLKKIDSVHDQVKKIGNTNIWGDRFSQGYYGRVFDDQSKPMNADDTTTWPSFHSRDMVNFDMLADNLKHFNGHNQVHGVKNKYNSLNANLEMDSSHSFDLNQRYRNLMKNFPWYHTSELEQGKHINMEQKLAGSQPELSGIWREDSSRAEGQTESSTQLETWAMSPARTDAPNQNKGVPAPEDYTCPGLFGYHKDPQNCQAFFICSWGMAHRVVCPPGTLYNSKEAVCDWAVNIRCTVTPDNDHSSDV